MDPSEATLIGATTAPVQNQSPSTAQIPSTSLPPPHCVAFSQPRHQARGEELSIMVSPSASSH